VVDALKPEGRRRLGEILLRQKVIEQDQLQKALVQQRESGGSLGKILMDMGFADQAQILHALAHQCRIATIHLPEYTLLREVQNLIDSNMARSTLCVLLDRLGDILTVAIQDPLDCLSLLKISVATGLKVKPVAAPSAEILTRLQEIHGEFKPYHPTQVLSEALTALRHACSSSPTTPFGEFTFDRFIVSEANDFAYAAARAVTETPLEMYNPLYLEGGPGVGKTHLLHAMANTFQNGTQGVRCFWAKVAEKDPEQIHEWLDHIDRPCAILIDSLEAILRDQDRMDGLISVLARIAEEDFVHLAMAGRIGPTDLPELGNLWSERFAMGVVIPMGQSDRIARTRFLQELVRREGIDVPLPCVEMLEQRSSRSMGALELSWGLLRSFAWTSGQPITVELCDELLDHIEPRQDTPAPAQETEDERQETLRFLELISEEILSLSGSSLLPMSKALRILESLQTFPEKMTQRDFRSLRTSMRELSWLIAWYHVSLLEKSSSKSAFSSPSDGDIEVVDLHVEENLEILSNDSIEPTEEPNEDRVEPLKPVLPQEPNQLLSGGKESLEKDRRRTISEARHAARHVREARIAQALATEVRNTLAEFKNMVLTQGERSIIPQIENLLEALEQHDIEGESNTLLIQAEKAKKEVLRFSEKIMERLQFEDTVHTRKASITGILNEIADADLMDEIQDHLEEIRADQAEVEQLLLHGHYASASDLLEKIQTRAETFKVEAEQRRQRKDLLRQTEEVSRKLDEVESILSSMEQRGATSYLPEDLKKVYQLFTRASRSLRRETVSQAMIHAEEAYAEVLKVQISLEEYFVTFQSKIEDIVLEGRQIVEDLHSKGAHVFVEDDLVSLHLDFDEALRLSADFQMKEAECLCLEATSRSMILREKALNIMVLKEKAQERLDKVHHLLDRLQGDNLPASLHPKVEHAQGLLQQGIALQDARSFKEALSLADRVMQTAQEIEEEHRQIKEQMRRYAKLHQDALLFRKMADQVQAEIRCPDLYPEVVETLHRYPADAKAEDVAELNIDIARTCQDLQQLIGSAQRHRNQEISQRVIDLREQISKPWDQVAHLASCATEESLKVEVREFLETSYKAEGLGEMDQALEAVEVAYEAMMELLDTLKTRRENERAQLEEVQSHILGILDRFATEDLDDHAKEVQESFSRRVREGIEQWEKEGIFEEVLVTLRQIEEDSDRALASFMQQSSKKRSKKRFEDISRRVDELEKSTQQLEDQDVLSYLPSLYRNVCQCIKDASQSLMEEDLDRAIPVLERAETLVEDMQDNLHKERKKEESEAWELLLRAEKKLQELKGLHGLDHFENDYRELEHDLSKARECLESGNRRDCEKICLRASEELLVVQRRANDLARQNDEQLSRIEALRSDVKEWTLQFNIPSNDETIHGFLTSLQDLENHVHNPSMVEATVTVDHMEKEVQDFKRRMEERQIQLEETAQGTLVAVIAALDRIQDLAPSCFIQEMTSIRSRGEDLMSDRSYDQAIDVFEGILEKVTLLKDEISKEKQDDLNVERVAVEKDISEELSGIRGALHRMKQAFTSEETKKRNEFDSQLASLQERLDSLASEKDIDGLAERMDGAHELLHQIHHGMDEGKPIEELQAKFSDVEQCIEILENQKLLREEISIISQEIEGMLDLAERISLPAPQREALNLSMDLQKSAQEAYQIQEWEAGWSALNQADEILKELRTFATSPKHDVTTQFSTADLGQAMANLTEEDSPIQETPENIGSVVAAYDLHFGPLTKQVLASYRPGNSNELVLNAIREIAGKPGKFRNPCIIVGDKGTGKSHLLNGLAHELCKENKEGKVLCMDAIAFGKAFLNAMTDGSVDEMRSELQTLDALLLDDIIDLGDVDTVVQDNLVRLMSILLEKNNQIFFTSKTDPIQSRRLEAEFRQSLKNATQLELRLIELDTRLQIIQELCDEWSVTLTQEVTEQLASSLGNNLPGYGEAIQRILSYSYLTGQDVSKKSIKKICKEIMAESE